MFGIVYYFRCLIISEKTTAAEVVTLLLRLHEMEALERNNQFYLIERCPLLGYERRLGPEECPAEIQRMWTDGFHEEVEARFQIRIEEEEEKEDSSAQNQSSTTTDANSCWLPWSSSQASICQEFSCSAAGADCPLNGNFGCEIEIRDVSDISVGQDLSVVDSPDSPIYAQVNKNKSTSCDRFLEEDSDPGYSYIL